MLELHGDDGVSSEALAARSLCASIAREFPSIVSEQGQELHVFISVQTPFVPNCKNVDIFLLGKFDPPLTFWTLDEEQAKCHSLALSLELKSHTPPGVWLEGDQVWVQYDSGPSSATVQAYNQPFAVKAFWERKGFDNSLLPFISEFVWLNQCRAEQFRLDATGLLDVIFADTTFGQLLAKTLGRSEASNLRVLKRGFDFESAVSVLGRVLIPTKLARSRIEAIADSSYLELDLNDVGVRQVTLDGYGGAGKTALLLRVAKSRFERGLRTLILTYHTALTSDLYRQLTLLGTRQASLGRSVNVETLHRFFREWIRAIAPEADCTIDNDWFDRRYRATLAETLSSVESGKIARDQIRAARRAQPALFDYAAVMIDEAQDWYDEERDFLRFLYSEENVVVNIGHQQLVRSTIPCDWTAPSTASAKAISLTTCLRLKQNLVTFVNALAHRLGDQMFTMRGAEGAVGGSVHIVKGRLPSRVGMLMELIKEQAEGELSFVDHLFCVPSTEINRDVRPLTSVLGDAFRKEGYAVYDAVDRDVRLGPPSSVEEIRIVQYESCRGLEGWLVGLDQLDVFYNVKAAQAMNEPLVAGAEFLRPEMARASAREWILIPLTRAIDTLVIGISDEASELGAAILSVAELFPDFVRVHRHRIT